MPSCCLRSSIRCACSAMQAVYVLPLCSFVCVCESLCYINKAHAISAHSPMLVRYASGCFSHTCDTPPHTCAVLQVGSQQGAIGGLALGGMQFVMFCSYAVALFYGKERPTCKITCWAVQLFS